MRFELILVRVSEGSSYRESTVFHSCIATIEFDYSILALYKQKVHSEYSMQLTV